MLVGFAIERFFIFSRESLPGCHSLRRASFRCSWSKETLRTGSQFHLVGTRMGKAGEQGRSRSASTISPSLKLFRPISWYGGGIKSASDYAEHLLTELGRLRLEVHDIERRDRPPHTETVLSDLMDWFSGHPSKAYAKLVDWRMLDLPRLQARLERDRSVKPRIELSAHITKMRNLSVRWHPKDWRNAIFDWHRTDHNHFNLITHRKWTEPPDFHWFEGDEEPTFDSRPSNELVYLRGVGNLRPEPCDTYGPYATFNDDVVASILICAVRAAYERSIASGHYARALSPPTLLLNPHSHSIVPGGFEVTS